ncbi:hypothetical protein CASFOL_014062 [Castilleja foliolosa]|uniref:Regulatory protein RecX n=1 Tax=Castilleja foliolosa TaxID=1961234 RepID=A0ABD3DPL6_9LAMI
MAGTFLHGFAVKLHYRVFLVSRAKRDTAIIRCCAKGRRDYCSSFPIKYIPKKSPENQENGDPSFPVKYAEKSHDGPVLNLAKMVNFPDINSKNHGAFRASNINYGLNLESNDEFIEETENIVDDSSEACSGTQSSHDRKVVEKLAIELLASRAFTALELKKKLQAKKFALEIVDEVITDFQSRGLINDCLYAETYSRSRWSSSSWGPRRIKQALSKKGVSEADTQNAIKQVFESEDEDSGINMSKLSMDQLYIQASKQWQRSQGASQDTRKSRIIRWLQYRGFDWNVISYVLKKLGSDNHS